MRIGINLLWLVPGDVGGSEGWVTGLLGHLARNRSDVEVVVFGSAALLDAHPWLDAFEVVRAPGGTSRPRRVAAESSWLAAAARRAHLDLLHHPGGTLPLLRSVPSMLTIHDLQPLVMPEHFTSTKRAYLERRLGPSVRAARLTTGVSEFTRADVVARLGVAEDRTAVTPPAVDPDPMPSEVEVRTVYRLDRPYFLYPAITYAHKDHAVLVDALAAVPDALLVLTGGAGPEEDALRSRAERVGVGGRIRRPGHVPEAHLDALYRGAVACAFPSRFEAVGLPVLEAMARRCPVVASSAAGLAAVVGDAGDLVAPGDRSAWAAALQRVLDDDGHRADLVAAGRARVQGWAPSVSAGLLVAAWRQAARDPGSGAVAPGDPGSGAVAPGDPGSGAVAPGDDA